MTSAVSTQCLRNPPPWGVRCRRPHHRVYCQWIFGIKLIIASVTLAKDVSDSRKCLLLGFFILFLRLRRLNFSLWGAFGAYNFLQRRLRRLNFPPRGACGATNFLLGGGCAPSKFPPKPRKSKNFLQTVPSSRQTKKYRTAHNRSQLRCCGYHNPRGYIPCRQ